MNGGTPYSIGELARRTGLTVKTVRYYSDRGLVTPVDRTPAGYRRYGPDAVARLALVRTLRELGIGLDVIRRVTARERTLGEVAAEHVAALDVQIEVLRLRRAVLGVVAAHGTTPEEMARMHRLATLTAVERRRLVDDFLHEVFDGLGDPARHAGPRRTLTPDLPDDPTEEQLAAWVELAGLALDPEFRADLRHLVRTHLAELPTDAGAPPRPGTIGLARLVVGPALAAGTDPGSPGADPVVAEFTARCALLHDRPDDPALRRWLLDRLDGMRDPRKGRYFRLLALVNGWQPPRCTAPVIDWTVAALRLRTAG
ncbi:MerR family transcriptional regulator [Streptomyces sp. NPDC049906]|uniref:MerR family transcriptional regulator n=1 Tax=Streptomyces sp. NPDC049906 TaxID=3155656 RepID=UPI0034247F9A